MDCPHNLPPTGDLIFVRNDTVACRRHFTLAILEVTIPPMNRPVE